MGTETGTINVLNQSLTPQRVKLNNPLMGTETCNYTVFMVYSSSIVKLNNPLMGTETFIPLVFPIVH